MLKLLGSFENLHIKSALKVMDLALVLIKIAKMWKDSGLLADAFVPRSFCDIFVGWLFLLFSPQIKKKKKKSLLIAFIASLI